MCPKYSANSEPDILSFLALGDSYTIGEGVQLHETWPYQLQKAMLKYQVQLEPPTIVARTGWSSAELEIALGEADLRAHYDLVTLLIGVNDQYRGYSIESFETVYLRLLKKALTLAGGQSKKVLALSIPDWSVTPFAKQRDTTQIAESIDAFNQSSATLCQQQGITFIDITERSREAGAKPGMLVADQLHPSALQYAGWIQVFGPILAEQLCKVRSN